MKRKITLFIAGAAVSGAVLAAAAFGEASSASSSPPSKRAIVVLRQTALGKILVDARGRTLYLFEKDKHGRSACYGACATAWPPLVSTAKPRARKGVHASLLGVTKRAGGKRQVTYAGHPLYTFTADKKAGQTIGEGVKAFGAAWDAVAASGRAVEPAASDPGGNDGGYGGGYGSGR